jgi:hypothetical protein
MKKKVKATVVKMTIDRGQQQITLVMDQPIDLHVSNKCKIEFEI